MRNDTSSVVLFTTFKDFDGVEVGRRQTMVTKWVTVTAEALASALNLWLCDSICVRFVSCLNWRCLHFATGVQFPQTCLQPICDAATPPAPQSQDLICHSCNQPPPPSPILELFLFKNCVRWPIAQPRMPVDSSFLPVTRKHTVTIGLSEQIKNDNSLNVIRQWTMGAAQ